MHGWNGSWSAQVDQHIQVLAYLHWFFIYCPDMFLPTHPLIPDCRDALLLHVGARCERSLAHQLSLKELTAHKSKGR